jgi:hypothetical protein
MHVLVDVLIVMWYLQKGRWGFSFLLSELKILEAYSRLMVLRCSVGEGHMAFYGEQYSDQ